MPVYEIEQYEIWSSKVRIEADDKIQAIKLWEDGAGEPIDNSSEYIEMADERMSRSCLSDQELDQLGYGNDGIPSLREIDEAW